MSAFDRIYTVGRRGAAADLQPNSFTLLEISKSALTDP